MKANLSKILSEKFGMPLDSVYGTKIGDLKGITDVGAVGVRDVSEDVVVCPTCGEMPINGQCNCDHSSGEDEGQVCPGCNMMIVGGECGCEHEICAKCGEMPPEITSSCGCGLSEAKSSCSQCGMQVGEAACKCEMKESDDRVKSRSYDGGEYKASKGSLAAIKKHGGSKKKAVKAGAFDWAKDPWAAARAAEIVKTGRAKATRGPKSKG